MIKRWYKIKAFVFNGIRKFFWLDYDSDEEFTCGFCGEPAYYRVLYCSEWCEENHATVGAQISIERKLK